MSRVLQVGLIGCGRIAQWAHLPALTKAADVKLLAVCDTAPSLAREIAERYRVKSCYTEPEALLEDGAVDAVVIAVPDSLHVPLARQALEAGKHVLVEKPLGLNREECLDLRAVLEQTGLTLQVGAMKRHDPGLEYAADFAHERLGAVISCAAWYRASTFKQEWHATLASPLLVSRGVQSGALNGRDREDYYLSTHGAHLFDSVRYVVGDAAHVTARHVVQAGTHVWQGVLELEDGGLAQFELAVSVPASWSEGLVVYGERGNVSLRSHFPFFLSASHVRAFDADRRVWSEPTFGDSDPFKRQLEAFARAIRGDVPVSPSIDDGIAALDLIAAVEQSTKDGRRATVAVAA